MIFQAMFAIITPALICGAYAERVKFKGFVAFSLLWATFVYDPIAHWVWGGGYFKDALDFAGGTVVHMSSGYSALDPGFAFGDPEGLWKRVHDSPQPYDGAFGSKPPLVRLVRV